MRPSIVNIRISSASPLRVRTVAVADGQISSHEMAVDDLRFVATLYPDGTYRFKEFFAKVE